MDIKKEYEKFFERKKNDLCVHDAEDAIAFAKHYQALQLQQTGVSGRSEQLCGNLDENYNCKNMCLTHCIDGNKFYKQHNCH